MNALYIQLTERQQRQTRRQRQQQYQKELNQQVENKRWLQTPNKISPVPSPSRAYQLRLSDSAGPNYFSANSNQSPGFDNNDFRSMSPNQKLTNSVVINQLFNGKSQSYDSSSPYRTKNNLSLSEHVGSEESRLKLKKNEKPLGQTKSVFVDSKGMPISKKNSPEEQNQFMQPDAVTGATDKIKTSITEAAEEEETNTNNDNLQNAKPERKITDQDILECNSLVLAYKINSLKNGEKLREVLEENRHKFPTINRMFFSSESEDSVKGELHALAQLFSSTVAKEEELSDSRKKKQKQRQNTEQLDDISDMLKQIQKISRPQRPKPAFKTKLLI